MLPGIQIPPGDGGEARPEPEPPGPETQTPIDLSQHNVVVVIPAYNEGRCIGSVILRALQHPVRVVVVDDGSCDDTAAIAEAAGATVVRLEHNCGKGVALRDVTCGQVLPEQVQALLLSEVPEQVTQPRKWQLYSGLFVLLKQKPRLSDDVLDQIAQAVLLIVPILIFGNVRTFV